MKSNRRALSKLSLDKAFLVFMALGALVFFGATLVPMNSRVEKFQSDILRDVIDFRADHLGLDLVNLLERHWQSLEGLATTLPYYDKATVRGFLSREVADGSVISWAGYVGLQGDVLIAADQRREGENVATEDWFIRSQRGPFAGMAMVRDGSSRLVMTVPIQSSGHQPSGYLTFHISSAWLDTELGAISRSLGVDFAVFDSRGLSVLTSSRAANPPAELASVRNATAGHEFVNVEAWPGIGERFVSVVPRLPENDLPDLGWRVVVLIQPDLFETETRAMQTSLSEILVLVAVMLFAMSVAFIRVFLVPLHRLVENAHAIADGDDVVPAENHRTTELSLLSSAISRLQGRILRAEDQLARVTEEIRRG